MNMFVISMLLMAAHLLAPVWACVRNETFPYAPGVTVQIRAEDPVFAASGSLSILDGCHFQIRNFTLFPAAMQAYWYGFASSEPSERGFKIVEYGVIGFWQYPEVNYTLRKAVSWSQIKMIKVISEFDNRTLASANFLYATTKDGNSFFGVGADKNGPGVDSRASRQSFAVAFVVAGVLLTLIVN